jgi:chromosome segregation ATPase
MDRIEEIKENLKAIGNFLSPDLRKHITWVHESYIEDVHYLLTALEEKEKELESWRGSRDGVLQQITECEYRELQAEAKYTACHEELVRCSNDLAECRRVANNHRNSTTGRRPGNIITSHGD